MFSSIAISDVDIISSQMAITVFTPEGNQQVLLSPICEYVCMSVCLLSVSTHLFIGIIYLSHFFKLLTEVDAT